MGLLLSVVATLAAPGATAEDLAGPSAGDLGGIGLWQTRTARFAADGQLESGASYVSPYKRYYVTLQATSWLEATFRYSDLTLIRLGSDTFKDRGADLKFRLLDESAYAPAIAVGLQDGLGTGLFQGEYVVASKRLYDFDFSLGIGWGILGERGNIRNPFTLLSDDFRDRVEASGEGGKFNIGTYFGGERAAIFGGIEYHTPIQGLSAKLEYDGNDYKNEPRKANGNRFDAASSPFNFGLHYRPTSWLDIGVARERGNETLVRVALRANLNAAGITKSDVPPLPVTPRPEPAAPAPGSPGSSAGFEAAGASDTDRAADGVMDAVEAAGLSPIEVALGDDELRLWVAEPMSQPLSARIQSAVSRVIAAAPETVRRIVLIGGGADAHPVAFDVAEVQRTAQVDALFEAFERSGFMPEAIEFSQREVVIRIAGPVQAELDPKLARAVLAATPDAIGRITVTGATGRVSLSRADVVRESGVDDMFERLEGAGFSIQAVSLRADDVLVTVAVRSDHGPLDYRAAGEIVAQSLGTPAHEVTIVGVRDGLELARVTVLPHDNPAGATTGGEEEPPPAPGTRLAAAQHLLDELEGQGIALEAVHFTSRRATVFVTPRRYRQAARNIGRAARVIARNAPPAIEEISVATMSRGMVTNYVTLLRRDLENALAAKGSAEEIWAHVQAEGATEPVPEAAITPPRRYPGFRWTVSPQSRQFIGDARQFLLYQFFARARGTLEIARGLELTGVVGANLYNNFDKIQTDSDSILPHVRSDIARYLQEAPNKVLQLETSYYASPIEDWFVRLSAGYFEEMFAGVGGEVLYRPFGSRWAVGLDLNRVQQRDFEGAFGLQDYSVTTGHANLYYNLPFYDLTASLHVGQFLAGDRGASYYLTRRFENGIAVGVWATLTNVSAQAFGEGSFDKGFFITAPLDLFLRTSSLNTAVFAFRPLSRDGGQMLLGSKRLYDVVADGNLDNVAGEWDQLLN